MCWIPSGLIFFRFSRGGPPAAATEGLDDGLHPPGTARGGRRSAHHCPLHPEFHADYGRGKPWTGRVWMTSPAHPDAYSLTIFSPLQDEKNQVLTTNVWLQMVRFQDGVEKFGGLFN